MIRHHVSAALLVRDGFTARPFASGSALVCRLDGRPVRPVFKPGGYLVLTDLAPGEYSLTLAAQGFFPETVLLSVSSRAVSELEVSLRPDDRYAFPPDTARLRLELTGPEGTGVLSGEEFWVGWPAPVQLRLAQNVEAGEDGAVRLYCSGAAALLPVPGQFLLLDEKQPELLRLRELRDGFGELDGTAAFPHSRGTVLVPAMRFVTGEDGRTELAFPRGGTVSLFCRSQVKSTDLRPGTADLRWTPEERPEKDAES